MHPYPAVPSYARPTTSIILKAYQPDYGRDAAMLNENELAEQSVKYHSLPRSCSPLFPDAGNERRNNGSLGV